MRLQIASDIHAEFHRDQGVEFVKNLKEAGTADVLVVAGDMATFVDSFKVVSACSENWAQVVMVLGNHEHYLSDRKTVRDGFRRWERLFPNLSVLDDQTVTVGRQRIVGSTLWFPDTPDARIRARKFSDFEDIEGLDGWVWDANRKARAFLRKTVRPSDIVVTHHVPVARGSDSRWVGSFLQPFFICPMDDVIAENKPKLWVYGHTHDSHDFTLCETRFVCNPFGYINHPEQRPNPEFDWGKFIDV